MKNALISMCLLFSLGFSVVTFVSEPALTKDSENRLWASFTVSESTDVAVSIVDARDSTIIRHLAGGKLGMNAPLPLASGTLAQRIEWDGKDDLGYAIASPESMAVRVQAGMGVKLKAIIGDNPYAMNGNSARFGGSQAGPASLAIAGMVKGSDGSVFVCGTPGPLFHYHEGWSYLAIRQYDRNGNYLKTLFPIPSGMDTARISGWGLRVRGDGTYVLENASTSMPTYSKTLLAGPNGGGNLLALDENGGMLFGNYVKLISLPQDGSLPANRTSFNLLVSPALPSGYNRTGATFLTLLPNGKEALLSGFFHYIGANGHVTSVPDTHFYSDGRIFKVNLATGAASLFLKLDSVPQPVADRLPKLLGGEFYASIHGTAVDNRGRVYVCDRLNRRIGVYDTLANFLGSIPLNGADNVAVSSNGAVYAVVRTQSGTGSGTGQIRICRFRPFDEGGAEAASLVLTASVITSSRAAQLAVCEGPTDTLLWVGYATTNVKIYRCDPAAFTLVRDFTALSDTTLQGYARLNVDRRNETVYINNTWYGIYKIEDWSNPRPVVCSTLINSVKRPLLGKDMAVSPHGMLYVLEGGLFDGPVKRFSTEHYHAPLNWSNTGANIQTTLIGGRYGGTTGARGLCVAPDNRVLTTWGTTPFFTSWYADSGAVAAGGDTLITAQVSKIGSPRVDLKGNLYLAAQTTAPGRVLPAGFAGDWAFGNGTGTIIKFPAGLESGAVAATAVSGAAKVYDISIAPFSQDRGAGGCICRSPRFDVDAYGRIFAANAVTCEVTVADNEGNLIRKFGTYGNSDNRFNADSTSVPLLHPLSVAASEGHIYIADYANCRLLRLKMDYALDNLPGMDSRLSAPAHPDKTGRITMTCRPNPFNPASTIIVRLSREERVRLDVFDATGRHVTTLAWDRLPAGSHPFVWAGRDLRGRPVAAGVYYYRLIAGARQIFRKTVLAK